jgi:Zn-finger nucleic acid-binding protein
MRLIAACKNCNVQYDVTGHQANESFHCRCGGLVLVPEVRLHEARLVRCASCGAVRGSGGLNCEYCGARLSTVDKGWGSMCPGCFCRLPTDASFCVECGLKISPQKLEAVRSDLICPRCTIALQSRLVDKIEVFECASCVGIWLGVSYFEAICQDSETRTKAKRMTGMFKAGRRQFELTAEEQVRYVPCPACRNLMNRRNFGGVSGVIIDLCKDHGVWLDNQELNRIVQFIESGGMDRAREVEARDREHAERMRTKTAPVLAEYAPVAFRYERHEVTASVLGRALGEVARAFLSGL